MAGGGKGSEGGRRNEGDKRGPVNEEVKKDLWSGRKVTGK